MNCGSQLAIAKPCAIHTSCPHIKCLCGQELSCHPWDTETLATCYNNTTDRSFKNSHNTVGYKRWRMTFLPLTKAMFSPRPTLFFTLLNNLWNRNIRGWSTNWSTLEEHLPLHIHINLHTLPGTWGTTTTTTNIKRTKTTDKNKEPGGRDRLKEYLHSAPPDRLGGLVMRARRKGKKKEKSKKRTECETKKKRKKTESREDKDIEEQKGTGKRWISHLVLQADFGPDDVGSTRHQAESQMFWGTWSWKSTFIPSRVGFS